MTGITRGPVTGVTGCGVLLEAGELTLGCGIHNAQDATR
jgi:hypothetical protein